MTTSQNKPAAESRTRTAPKAASPQKPPTSAKPNPIAEELENLLHLAFVNARARRHEFITVEHLLYSLAEAEASRETLTACGADVETLKSRLAIFIDENTPIVESKGEVETQPALGFRRVIQRAIMYVQSVGKKGKQVGSNDVLLGVFGEKDSHAVYFLHQEGVTRIDVANFIAHGERKDLKTNTERSESIEVAEAERAGREFYSFVSDATQQLAARGKKEKERPKLFISYSHVDTACLDRLLVHLKPLER